MPDAISLYLVFEASAEVTPAAVTAAPEDTPEEN